MKLLNSEFRKNGLYYTLLKRTDKIALFQLGFCQTLMDMRYVGDT
jgi:hypothetical protein